MKFFRVLALIIGLSLTTPACDAFRAKDPSAMVVDAAPAIYNSLVSTLQILDLLQAGYVREMDFPTPEELEMVRDNILRIDDARRSLIEVKSMIEKDEVKLDRLVPHVKVAVDNLALVASDLEKFGVRVPSTVKDSLAFVQKYILLLARG